MRGNSLLLACLAGLFGALASDSEVSPKLLEVEISPREEAFFNDFRTGTQTNPVGRVLGLDNKSLLLDGRRWFPVMGEFHYSRYPSNEWRGELLKMRAGGVDIVATYVFWIHHEEVEGEFDWSGQRDLRQFIKLCGDVGLKAIVRCGPWCHGEVRNGGFPDWLLKKGWRLRSDDTNYLEKVRVWYGQISRQLSGLLWKDGGPVIGIQLENEYRGGGGHLLTLKRIAREVGLDVPLYTRTGWPALARPLPPGEILPMYGAYAEGFWDRELIPMPGRYWAAFHFSHLRMDENIANEMLGRREARDEDDARLYPYLTCEIGGGMMSSYHRRIRIDPPDIESIALVKLGSGSVLLGYYMYHGGVNPEGKLTTLNESQRNNEWNDLPVKNYDFQAPIGQYGQIRTHYHLLRRLHMFLQDWGAMLAEMPSYLPSERPKGRADHGTVRWAVRAKSPAGFLFVNNYQRLQPMPPKSNIQFQIKFGEKSLIMPHRPVTIPADCCFFWPFNMPLGDGVTLRWATAQPICRYDGDETTIFFRAIPGIPAWFAFDFDKGRCDISINEEMACLLPEVAGTVVEVKNPGLDVAVEFSARTKAKLRIVVLTEEQSLRLWKMPLGDRSVVIYSPANLSFDGNRIFVTTTNLPETIIGLPPGFKLSSPWRKKILSQAPSSTKFQTWEWWIADFGDGAPVLDYKLEVVQPRGRAPEVKLGPISRPVATQPQDEDFVHAGRWRITLPERLPSNVYDVFLNIDYVGDVARVVHEGRLLLDDFFNGLPLEIGLRRHLSSFKTNVLDILILPLRKDAPIYIDPRVKPAFGEGVDQVCELRRVWLTPVYKLDAILEH